MSDAIRNRILEHLKIAGGGGVRPRRLARALSVQEEQYPAFRNALRELMHEGRVVAGARGTIVLPTQKTAADRIVGTYRHNARGFGFVVPTDPTSHEDLYIPEGENAGAITGDIVSAKIISRGQRDGKALYTGRIVEILQRTHTRFVGTLARSGTKWLVLPDGNTLPGPILTPDAASRHLRAGTKVVVELTSYPDSPQGAQGVITEVIGQPGEKDVDLRCVVVQFGLDRQFTQEHLAEARRAVDQFNQNLKQEMARRMDLTDQTVVTIDPDDAKDYDDAISLRQLKTGQWELGVHIADVSHFVTPGSPLDQEALERGNSCYFPGHVIPMLPEVLSNGVCSLQEGVPRLCKSVFITLDDAARPIATRFANTVIRSRCRLRYREAQAIIDGEDRVPHPDGQRRVGDYEEQVVGLLRDMDALARRMQKRRVADGQINLDLPEVELVLDEDGRVVGARPEGASFTHTMIEMFMVEANEAVARLLDGLNVPFLRRIHPGPDAESLIRLRHFVQVAGHRLPREMDRKAIQSLLAAVRGKPESYAINLAVLKSLSRAEYSPERIGHFALASEHYCHFTSPIRRYADLTIHRLMEAYLRATGGSQRGGRRWRNVQLEGVIPEEQLGEIGKHISFTERRADDAERELRKVKLLELLAGQVGRSYSGVVTGIANFGIFVQIRDYLIDGLIRYEHLLDDWWDVDEKGGYVRGQRSGRRIGIGDVCTVIVARVDVARRELDLSVTELHGRPRGPSGAETSGGKVRQRHGGPQRPHGRAGGRRQGGRRR